MESVDMSEYSYELPEARIAAFPLAERDQSKLLVYQDGKIINTRFDALASFLPPRSTLFFNNTKVIPARLLFTKDTGAVIEIFLLNPKTPERIFEAMEAKGNAIWKCSIGNLKRWTEHSVLTLTIEGLTLQASLISRDEGLVNLIWSPATFTFAEMLNRLGSTPLPPYIRREVTTSDRKQYQTVYAQADGAVAAPTAGLHFTDTIIHELGQKGHRHDFLTLHVSAGTFQPVKVNNAVDHPMHTEQILITAENIRNLREPGRKVVAVGTTSMRTLESLYWYGVKLLENSEAIFRIDKMDPYQTAGILPTPFAAFEAVARMMEKKKLSVLAGETSILILPGYRFKACHALVTNFHQPGSTLILLVAAFVGKDWRVIYQHALANDYRFLSYGDSSLLFPADGDA